MKEMEPIQNMKKNRASKRVALTRGRLVDSALKLFTSSGVDATTIEEITEGADLGKGTFYRHFSGKGEIMAALFEGAVGRLIEGISQPPEPGPTLEKTLEHLVKGHSNFFLKNNDEFILIFQGRLLLKLQRNMGTALEEPLSRYLEEIERQLSPFFSKQVDPMKIRRLAFAVAGFVSGFFSFAMIDIALDELESSIRPLREAFVRACSAFLVEQS